MSLLQESHALCLAERDYGLAKGLDDFAVLDVSTGIGLGVMLGGRLLKGHSGLAGEIGHITAVAEGGRKCGCGNTAASKRSRAIRRWRHAGRKLGRAVYVDEVIDLARSGTVDLAAELDEIAGYLAVGVAAVINLFNPAVVFIHSPLFEVDATLFEPGGGANRPASPAAVTSPSAGSSARKGASVRARWRVSFST